MRCRLLLLLSVPRLLRLFVSGEFRVKFGLADVDQPTHEAVKVVEAGRFGRRGGVGRLA